MKISIGISNHHVHLSHEDLKILFDNELTIRNYLKQPNEFASNQTVDIIGPKGEIKGLRILGPTRNYTQVEVTKTDCYKLGINAPVKNSGDLQEAAVLKIVGPKATIERKCAIIATRHIHVDEEIRKKYNLININEVKIQISGDKSGIIEHVYLKEQNNAVFELHLDTDDANAFLLNNTDEVEIIK